jgi:predicted nucleic acid-binding Zn ribbon protein
MPSRESKFPPHKHCPVCAKAMAENLSLCSDKCNQSYTNRIKRQKKFNRLYYISFGAIFVIMIVVLLLGGL